MLRIQLTKLACVLALILFAPVAAPQDTGAPSDSDGDIPTVTVLGARPHEEGFLGGGNISMPVVEVNGRRPRSGGSHVVIQLKPASRNNSNKEPDSACKSTVNPVVIATGEKHKEEPDFRTGGLYDLSLIRTYRGQHASGSLFGPNWLSSLAPARVQLGALYKEDWAWDSIPSTITFTDADGTSFLYTYTGHGRIESSRGGVAAPAATGAPHTDSQVGKPAYYIYQSSDAAATGQLIYTPEMSIKLKLGRLNYSFDEQSGVQYAVSDAAGLIRRYQYVLDASGQPRLDTITNTVGQSVRLTWGSSGRVQAVTDPAGNNWAYDYDANGMLTKVTAPGENPDVREYHYEAADTTLLTGITIGGKRYSTYAYYPDRRVSSSSLSDGQESDTFVYGDKSTKVTNAQGQETNYTFVDIQGELKVRGVSRETSSTCAAASAYTEYDANGYLDYTKDWSGNKTDYTYDAGGRLLDVTTAAGTADANTTAYTWDGDQVHDATYKDAGGKAYASVTYTYVVDGMAAGRVAQATLSDVTSGRQRITRYRYAFHPGGAVAQMSTGQMSADRELTTTLNFDVAGNLVSSTNALGQSAGLSDYNGLGQPGTVTDLNGAATHLSYRPNGTLDSATAPGNRVTTFAYDAARQLTSISYPDGSVTPLPLHGRGVPRWRGQHAQRIRRLFLRPGSELAARGLSAHGAGGRPRRSSWQRQRAIQCGDAVRFAG